MTGTIVVPVRVLGLAVGIVLVAAALALSVLIPGSREAVLRLTDPRTTAAPASLDQQRTATEHALQRGYLKATGQLAEVRKLTLAIPASQATAIAEKAVGDIKQVRHDALTAVGARIGLASPALETYVAGAETQLGDNAFPDDKPVLLAPDLYTLVARATELFQRTADAATRELTKAPSATGAPSATPTPTQRPTPTASPTPR